jgi:hypothetical protein
MSRYFSQPKASSRGAWDGWDYFDDRSTITVHEADIPSSVDTGLLDANGETIRRVVQRPAIGFRCSK